VVSELEAVECVQVAGEGLVGDRTGITPDILGEFTELQGLTNSASERLK